MRNLHANAKSVEIISKSSIFVAWFLHESAHKRKKKELASSNKGINKSIKLVCLTERSVKETKLQQFLISQVLSL